MVERIAGASPSSIYGHRDPITLPQSPAGDHDLSAKSDLLVTGARGSDLLLSLLG
jgi:hypothetical protein